MGSRGETPEESGTGRTLMFETCNEIRSHFSDVLDNLSSRETLRAVQYHLTYCAACRNELKRMELMQADLRSLPRQQVSAETALRLRVRLSQEIHRHLVGRLRVHLENALRPLLLPASAGVLTAVICFGLFLGAGVPPVTHTPDARIQLATPARVVTLAPMNFSTGDEPLVFVTYIDADGRATNYKVLSGEASPEITRQLDRMLLFSEFEPATTFGRPTSGQVVLSLRRITVRG